MGNARRTEGNKGEGGIITEGRVLKKKLQGRTKETQQVRGITLLSSRSTCCHPISSSLENSMLLDI